MANSRVALRVLLPIQVGALLAIIIAPRSTIAGEKEENYFYNIAVRNFKMNTITKKIEWTSKIDLGGLAKAGKNFKSEKYAKCMAKKVGYHMRETVVVKEKKSYQVDDGKRRLRRPIVVQPVRCGKEWLYVRDDPTPGSTKLFLFLKHLYIVLPEIYPYIVTYIEDYAEPN